tara:strand:- start:3589 stop:3849 length:261 start_codon:yes stop_codon:yes gene_type:complete
MGLELFLHPKVTKDVCKLDNSTKERVKHELSELLKKPNKGKHLKHSNYYSLRIGVYRAIYKIQKDKIIVLFFGHRKNVYSDFSKLF